MGQQGKNPSQTENFRFNDQFADNPALGSYMQMMGGGNNYGAVIGQQQQQVNNPPPPAASDPTLGPVKPNTRYGVYDPNQGYYQAYLPWGLTPWTTEGASGVMQGYGGSTPLQWDYETGHLVGGDELADAYRDTWKPSPEAFGIPSQRDPNFVWPAGLRPPNPLSPNKNAGGGRLGQWFNEQPIPSYGDTTYGGLPITQLPLWWESAYNPNSVLQFWVGDNGSGDFNWAGTAPDLYSARGGGQFTSHPGMSPLTGALSGLPPPVFPTNPAAPAVNSGGGAPANIIRGDDPSTYGVNVIRGSDPAIDGINVNGVVNGSGGGFGGGAGYSGSGNPWGGLNGIEDAMTAASAFGRRRRRG